jgi:aspartyl/glutamyl-tRNA(Asn/Gln) amidotransferase C subunit
MSEPNFTVEQTRRLAQLAQLELTEQEIELFAPQLAQIVRAMDELGEMDLSGIDPLYYPSWEAGPGEWREDRSRLWPQDAPPSILVPKVME